MAIVESNSQVDICGSLCHNVAMSVITIAPIIRPRLTAIAGALCAVLIALPAIAQGVHQAPASAPSRGRLAPAGEPGQPLSVSGVVATAEGTPVRGASLYVYQTDAEGYYGVKPASDNRNPRLKLYLRTDERGAWAFDTIKPGSYPGSRVPGHIHFEVSAPGRPATIYEIVFDGDPFVTEAMRRNPAFAVRPIDASGRVTDRIVLR
jgi:protocatechuate 3,4-dioxygenase beta subunit